MRAGTQITLRRLVSLLLVCVALEAVPEQGDVQINRDIHYGIPDRPDREFQTLDIYWENNESDRPVIVYVHGGGWAFGDKADVHSKPDYFVARGIAFVSMNYRLRWDYRVYDQARDIVSVIGWVHENAEKYGLDPSRLILMGHGAGAHLVSLVGTDEGYLKASDFSLSDVKSVVAIDTASFDIPRLMDELGSFVEKRHHRVIFGKDPKVWAASSPITHVEKDEALPVFALLYPSENDTTTLQTEAFAKKLSAAGASTIMIPGNKRTDETIDEELGRKGDPATQALMTFIRTQI